MWIRFRKLSLSRVFLAGVIVFILGLVPVFFGSSIIANTDQTVSLFAINDTLIEQKFMDIPSIKGCMEYYSFTGIDANATLSSTNRWAIHITVQYVDGHYEKVIEPDITVGRWLKIGDASMHGAVIDEELAFELYGHTDCVGETFEYRDETYTIIALCEPPSPFTSHEKHVVYLMYTEGSPVDYVGIIGTPTDSFVYAAKVFSTLGQEYFSYYTVYNMKSLCHQAWYLVRLLLLPPGIFLLVFFYRWIKKWILQRIDSIKEKLKVKYTRELLTEIILSSLGALILSGVWLLALGSLCIFFTQSLIHMEQFIPVSLVDIKAIKQTILSAIYRANNSNAVYNPPSVLAIMWGRRLLGLSTAFFYTGGVLMVAGIRRKQHVNKKQWF